MNNWLSWKFYLWSKNISSLHVPISQEKKIWAENICWYEWLFKQYYIFNVSVILISIPCWKFRAPICEDNLHLWEHWSRIIMDLRITMIIGILGEPRAFWWILHCPLIWLCFSVSRISPWASAGFNLKQASMRCLGILTPTFGGDGNCKFLVFNISSVAQSCLTFCDPWTTARCRPPCSSPTPRVYSNSCPWSRWCHPTISSSVVPFSSWLQSFSASGSFPMSQFFTSSGQSIGASTIASVLPVNSQGWFPLGLTGWISLLPKGLSRVFSNTTVQKDQFFGTQLSLRCNSHIHTWLLEKT